MDTNINNRVSIMGKIISEFRFSHEVYGEGFYNVDVEVKRLSEAYDVLPITISERLLEKNKLDIGTYIEIDGQFRSYNRYEEGKNKLILTVFVRDYTILEEEINQNPNTIELDGFLCKPTVYRTTPFGREITDLLIAVNRSYHKSDYIPCIAWGRNARYASNLEVGNNVKIFGRIQSRDYQKKLPNGEILTKKAYEVSISKMELIEQYE